VKRLPWIAGLAAAAAAVSALTLSLTTTAHADAQRPNSPTPKPTIVLVHGAWADASGWTPVIERLEKAGYPVDAPPNPLRGLTSDAKYTASVLKQIKARSFSWAIPTAGR
jgi:pimeloyl-ACP methyl ester carboxylesterase